MTDTDPATPSPANQYREMALSVRNLIPLMEHPEVRAQLSMLALQYEKLAEGLEAVSDSLKNSRAEGSVGQGRSSS
jgi:hypothetical protein